MMCLGKKKNWLSAAEKSKGITLVMAHDDLWLRPSARRHSLQDTEVKSIFSAKKRLIQNL